MCTFQYLILKSPFGISQFVENLLIFNRLNIYLTQEWKEIEKSFIYQHKFCEAVKGIMDTT